MSKGNDVEQTPEERELGLIATERWNDYQRRFVPVENEYIQSVQKTDSDFSEARGQTASAVQQSFAPAEDGLADNLFAQGITPDSGKFTAASEGLGRDRGLSMGTGLNETDVAVDNQHFQGLQNVVQMGQGQAADAVTGMGNVAADATRDSIARANTSYQNRQAGLHLAGTVAGAGTHAYTNRSPGLPPSSGTTTSYGSFDRTQYNTRVGKGGLS